MSLLSSLDCPFQGLDAAALARGDLKTIGSGCAINPSNLRLGIPMPRIQMLEFKVNFCIPMDSNTQAYNHALGLTDQIICRRFKIGNLSYPLPKELPSGLYIRDKLDNLGEICLSYIDPTTRTRVSVPPEFEGRAFFITDIRDSSGNLVQKHAARSTMHNAVFVVALDALAEGTFRNIVPAMEERVKWFGAPDDAEEEELIEPTPPSTAPSGRRSARTRTPANRTGRRQISTGRARNVPIPGSCNDDLPESSAAAAARGGRNHSTKKRSRK